MPQKYTLANVDKPKVFDMSATVIEQWRIVMRENDTVTPDDRLMALAISCILFAWNNPPE